MQVMRSCLFTSPGCPGILSELYLIPQQACLNAKGRGCMLLAAVNIRCDLRLAVFPAAGRLAIPEFPEAISRQLGRVVVGTLQ